MYHLDNELPGAHTVHYWHIHLISFSLAIQTAETVIPMALLFAAALRLIMELSFQLARHRLACRWDPFPIPWNALTGSVFWFYVLKSLFMVTNFISLLNISFEREQACVCFCHPQVGSGCLLCFQQSRQKCSPWQWARVFPFLFMPWLQLMLENTEWSHALKFCFLTDFVL